MVSANFYLRVKPLDTIQIIISVSKKISKSAVIRNKIKRRIRPIVRKLASDLKPGQYFIIVKSGAQNLRGKELENELKSLMIV